MPGPHYAEHKSGEMPRTTEVFRRSFLTCSLFWSMLYGFFVITGTTTESIVAGGNTKVVSTVGG